MKAIVLDQYGGPELLRYAEVERPAPGAGQVLVRIFAVSVNAGSVKRAAGLLRGVVSEIAFPWIPGGDFSGVIELAGDEVTDFGVGDEVFGFAAAGGAFAEFIVVDANAVAHKPRTKTHAEAASLALVGQTASQAVSMAGLKPGQTILILGAGGAVGNVAVQLAKRRGARVLAQCRSRSVKRLYEVGADVVINGDNTPFEAVAKGVDVVLDAIGGEFESRAFSVLKPKGILIALTQPPSQEEAERLQIRAIFLKTQSHRDALDALSREIDRGDFKTFIGRSYPLSETASSWIHHKSGLFEGKLVIEPKNGP